MNEHLLDECETPLTGPVCLYKVCALFKAFVLKVILCYVVTSFCSPVQRFCSLFLLPSFLSSCYFFNLKSVHKYPSGSSAFILFTFTLSHACELFHVWIYYTPIIHLVPAYRCSLQHVTAKNKPLYININYLYYKAIRILYSNILYYIAIYCIKLILLLELCRSVINMFSKYLKLN